MNHTSLDQKVALHALIPFQTAIRVSTSLEVVCQHIVRATEASDTYVFGELLDEPNVARLAQSDDSNLASHYRLLQVFAFHTWREWHENFTHYPKLSPTQERKLRILSILSAAKSHDQLKFSFLIPELGLSSEEELEDLLQIAISDGLIAGRIDLVNLQVDASSIAAVRDHTLNDIVHAHDVLVMWKQQIGAAIGTVQSEINRVNTIAQKRTSQLIGPATLVVSHRSGSLP